MDMQIKMNLIFYFIPLRMTKNKNQVTAGAGKNVEKKQQLVHCWWDCKQVRALCKSIWWLFRKLEVPVILLLSYTKKKLQQIIRAHAPLCLYKPYLYYPESVKPKCPSAEEQIQKRYSIYTMEYYSALKNNDFMKYKGK